MRSMSKSSYLWMKAYAPRGIRENARKELEGISAFGPALNA